MITNRKKIASNLRLYRKIHKYTGIITFLLFFMIAVTGILLGWKKNSNGNILPITNKGISNDISNFKSIQDLSSIAINELNKTNKNLVINRLDIRHSKGIVKITFKDSYLGMQIDATTGKVLQVQNRYSDLIENVHDGSYIDNLLNIEKGYFKLFYTTLTGLSLLIFCFTGFYLWFGPKMMRK